MDLFKTSWGLIWFCDQEAQKSHLWNPIRLQPWQRHMTWGTYIHPSPCVSLLLKPSASMAELCFNISGIWDYCKLNLSTWELSELQSSPGKRGSDWESELSTALLQGRAHAHNWVGQESCRWMDPRTISGCSGHRGRRQSRGLGFGKELQPTLHFSAHSPPCLQLQLGVFAEHTVFWIEGFPLQWTKSFQSKEELPW